MHDVHRLSSGGLGSCTTKVCILGMHTCIGFLSWNEPYTCFYCCCDPDGYVSYAALASSLSYKNCVYTAMIREILFLQFLSEFLLSQSSEKKSSPTIPILTVFEFELKFGSHTLVKTYSTPMFWADPSCIFELHHPHQSTCKFLITASVAKK